MKNELADYLNKETEKLKAEQRAERELATKKKFVTVCWSVVVEANLPDDVGVDELEDYSAPRELQEQAFNIVKNAYANVSAKDGVITDVQDMS